MVMGLRALPLSPVFPASSNFTLSKQTSITTPTSYCKFKVYSAKTEKGSKDEEEKPKIRKQNLFESVTEALDFSQVRSAEDAQLIEDARSATKSGEKMNREQPNRFQDYSRIVQHVYAGAVFVMYVSLLGFIQVKSQKQNYSPFETHVYFIVISLVALSIAIVTSGVLFYPNDHLESRNTKNIPPIHYLFLKVTFLFSTILAPLSLVIVLFIPPELNWIGYSIICALFTITVAYNTCCYIKLIEKKEVSNIAAHQIV